MGHEGMVPVSNIGDSCPSSLKNSDLGEGGGGGQRQGTEAVSRGGKRQTDGHIHRDRQTDRQTEADGEAEPLRVSVFYFEALFNEL